MKNMVTDRLKLRYLTTGDALFIKKLFKRDIFQYPDLGYAFLSRYWSQGYAIESAYAVIQYAKKTLRVHYLIGITSSENKASIKVLEKLGFSNINDVFMEGYNDPSRVFSIRI